MIKECWLCSSDVCDEYPVPLPLQLWPFMAFFTFFCKNTFLQSHRNSTIAYCLSRIHSHVLKLVWCNNKEFFWHFRWRRYCLRCSFHVHFIKCSFNFVNFHLGLELDSADKEIPQTFGGSMTDKCVELNHDQMTSSYKAGDQMSSLGTDDKLIHAWGADVKFWNWSCTPKLASRSLEPGDGQRSLATQLSNTA